LLWLPAVGDNAAMQTEPPKLRRRWFQFSLRTLLFFTLICAVGSALVARRMDQKHNEREIVEAILKLGGLVEYDYQIDRAKPPGPDWLRNVLGENYFSDVEVVILQNVPDADARLGNVKRLTQVQWLSLAHTNITDAGLVNLNGLTNLKTLYLQDAKVSDTGMVNLERLTRLRTLLLTNTSVSDVGIGSLKGLTNLKQLDVRGTRVTDAGVEYLQKALPNCAILH
jgi:Leucine Rich repeat